MNDWKELENIQNEQDIYRFLAQRYILEKTRLDRIDMRMKEYEIPFIPYPVEERDIYQKQDFMKLRYIYMRNEVHMERLTPEQIEVFETAKNHITEETAIVKAMTLVQNTYREVLSFSDMPDVEVELFPSISGEGNVPGDAIVFMIATIPDYDGLGNVKDWEKEHKKDNILASLKMQLEPVCKKALKMPVRFIIV